MGRIQAEEMAEMLDSKSAMAWHLQYNHYPPIPATMIEPCFEAIQAGMEEDWQKEIDMPDGVTYKGLTTAPAWAIIEQHHLDAWIEGEIY
jgi:hypothetical protein